MTAIEFSIRGAPHGKGRPRAYVDRGGRQRVRTPQATRDYERLVADLASWAAKGRTFAGPVRVDIIARRPLPRHPRPDHESRQRDACTAGPDADNIAKTILDGINASGLWSDDRQVVDLRVRRVWADPGSAGSVTVSVDQIGDIVCE